MRRGLQCSRRHLPTQGRGRSGESLFGLSRLAGDVAQRRDLGLFAPCTIDSIEGVPCS